MNQHAEHKPESRRSVLNCITFYWWSIENWRRNSGYKQTYSHTATWPTKSVGLEITHLYSFEVKNHHIICYVFFWEGEGRATNANQLHGMNTIQLLKPSRVLKVSRLFQSKTYHATFVSVVLKIKNNPLKSYKWSLLKLEIQLYVIILSSCDMSRSFYSITSWWLDYSDTALCKNIFRWVSVKSIAWTHKWEKCVREKCRHT